MKGECGGKPVLLGRYHLRVLRTPRFWLSTVGWRRRGRIDPAEVPG